MSSRKAAEGRARCPSDAENAMAANARSRDGQGKAEDHALREHHRGMVGAGSKEQKLRQPGKAAARVDKDEGDAARTSVAPETRSVSDARQDSSADERAVDEGMGEPRSGGPAARP